MRLYLVQHGEACAKTIDPERPLTDTGRADTERLAAFLARAGIRVAQVLHSGKLRAVQTAERLAEALAPGVVPEAVGGMNPNDSPTAFAAQLRDRDGDTLLVGHLPFMSGLVSCLLVGDEERLASAWQPGSVVCLEQSNGGPWHLAWMIRPELLG